MATTYQLPSSIDHSNVEQVLAAAVDKLSSLSSQETLLIDCQTLSIFDSSALSALLAIKRRASEKNIVVQLQAIPEKLASLAKVYGLAELVLA